MARPFAGTLPHLVIGTRFTRVEEIAEAPPVAEEARRFRGSAPSVDRDSGRETAGTTVSAEWQKEKAPSSQMVPFGPSVIIGSQKNRYINGFLVVGKRYSSLNLKIREQRRPTGQRAALS
jgi:hypothetical protein